MPEATGPIVSGVVIPKEQTDWRDGKHLSLPLAAHSWSCVDHASDSSKAVLERRCMLWVLGTLLPLQLPLSSPIFSQYFVMAFPDVFLHKNK